MKQIFILLFILFTSCKKDELTVIPFTQNSVENGVEIHLQIIEASAILVVDNRTINCNYLNEHTLRVYSFKKAKNIAIYKTSNGGKITAAIHDYTNRALYDLGEITSYHKYLLL